MLLSNGYPHMLSRMINLPSEPGASTASQLVPTCKLDLKT